MSEYSCRTSASSIADLLSEISTQAAPPKLKPKIQTKDYSRENILRVRQLSAARKNEKQDMNTLNSGKGDWFRLLPDKYSHVPAKITTYNDRMTSQTSKQNIDQTKNNSLIPSLNLENRNPNSSEKLTRPPSVPKLQLSYIRENANSAKYTRLKRCNSASDLDTKKINHQPGFVPKYLIDRKKQLILEKEKELERENSRVNPEGHILMPDKDRLETLKLMKQSEEELIQRLSSLPVCLGTLRLRKEKEEIEQRLAKLDEGIKIFSRSKVYIKNDA